MISLKNYKQNLLALFICCALVPCSSNGASQQIKQPLHKACEQGDVSTVQRLINSGVNINALDRNGRPALGLACLFDNLLIVQLLINSGANVNIPDECGWTALGLILRSVNTLELKLKIAKLLIDSGADVNIKDRLGRTSLHIACCDPSSKIVQLLIENGARVHTLSNKGETPLSSACVYSTSGSNLETVQLLVRHGAIITKTIPTYRPPNIAAYLNDIYNTDLNFNPLTTPATLELLQRFIARNMHIAYVLKHFLTQPQDIQKELVKHALLHNQNILIQFYPYTNCDQLLTQQMLADNTYLQKKHADYRKKLPLRTNANWWNTKALPLANTTITFNK